jgi:hypothetical protein
MTLLFCIAFVFAITGGIQWLMDLNFWVRPNRAKGLFRCWSTRWRRRWIAPKDYGSRARLAAEPVRPANCEFMNQEIYPPWETEADFYFGGSSVV